MRPIFGQGMNGAAVTVITTPAPAAAQPEPAAAPIVIRLTGVQTRQISQITAKNATNPFKDMAEHLAEAAMMNELYIAADSALDAKGPLAGQHAKAALAMHNIMADFEAAHPKRNTESEKPAPAIYLFKRDNPEFAKGIAAVAAKVKEGTPASAYDKHLQPYVQKMLVHIKDLSARKIEFFYKGEISGKLSTAWDLKKQTSEHAKIMASGGDCTVCSQVTDCKAKDQAKGT